MTTLQRVVGNANAPQDGDTTYSPPELRNAILHFIIIDNQIYNGLMPQPEYLFEPTQPLLTLGNGNAFKLGQKCIFVYSKICECA